MSKRLRLAAFIAAGVSVIFSTHAENPYGIPENIQDGNIMHCFDWKFTDIIEELPRIAEAGFGSVQVSPVQGNAGENAEWFYAYMPYDFAFMANGNGTREELKQLCDKAEEYGIKVIVDVVANHINSHPSYRNLWWSEGDRERYNGWINYSSRHSITHNQLGDYGDVNSESEEVQQRARAFIEDLKSIGVDGIRWDAAKHIGLPSEGCNFWPVVTSVEGLWHYGEILDNPAGSNASNEEKYRLLNEYAKYMSVTDNEYASTSLSSVKSWILPSKAGNLSEGVPASKLVYWGESHDTYSNDGGATKGTMQARIDRVYMLSACRDGATALYFSRPPYEGRTEIRMGQKGSVHCLEAPEIAAVNKFRNAMTGRAEAFTRSTGSKGCICITRKDGGVFILGKKNAAQNVEGENGMSYMPEGTYKDALTGTDFIVTPTTITGRVGSTGVAVLYADGMSAVEDIVYENNTFTEYYDLMGRRVENPQHGIYIRRTGNNVEKVIL